ncbi:type II toxin-antitoxin system RelE/ParE family toxin [Alkalibacter rhizosphaerae]|uniref:Type II toxin-antitoxin system RelE/ParE family toxin n=1 Tax=Alkalibacter rhizosphaerae TaxID=2815577 RepID=A0A975AJE8_9FIRM|nr:type II toxin-antitoxin system RelE/ParE family toxin [Alkalibacter rhizosphaerae]QSX09535.1 type II toxin-antitoxin system RelE/ParE family toxin [Alkalibacter rhizosphaerae]
MAYDIEFYQRENGDIPVLEFLESLPPSLGAKTFREIELLKEHGFSLREPHTKSLKGKNNKGLYELRVKFSSDIARVFYFSYSGGKFVLLHGFVKKTGKTPQKELDRARNYKEDYERRCKDE